MMKRLRSLFGRKDTTAGSQPGVPEKIGHAVSTREKMEEPNDQIKDPEVGRIEDEIRNRFLGCFLGLAIGDAKGMPAESKSIEESENVAQTFDYLSGYLPAGSFTDDTHHATFLAESLLDKKTFEAGDFMNKLSKMDMMRGYGPTTLNAIIRYMSGVPIDKSGLPSPTNGPAMRVAPLAMLYHYDIDKLREMTMKSASVTHNSPEAIAGAMTVAFSVAYMLNHYKEKFDAHKFLKELQDFVRPVSAELSDSLSEDAQLKERVGCRVMESVPHAIRIFMQDPYDFEKSISQAIRGGGDADTIAAMVGAISGAFNGLDKIPQQWIERLENSEKGRDYIRKIAEELYQLSKGERGKKTKQGPTQP